MKVNSDSFFTIGTSHVSQGLPCQDYALTTEGVTPGSHVAIIADGCSSSDNTDIGARVLAHRFKGVLRRSGLSQFNDELDFGFLAKSGQQLLLQELLLPETCLDASLCYVKYSPETYLDILAVVLGDGAVFVNYRNGGFELIIVDWALNTPPYVSYLCNPKRKFELLQTKQQGMVTRIFGKNFEQSSIMHRVVHMEDSFNGDLSWKYSSDEVISVSVMSDGIQQLGELSSMYAACELNHFKNFEGDFVKRRVIRALRDAAKHDNHPFDDVSIATLHFDRDE